MSESSDRESHDPPTFGGKDTKSESSQLEPSLYVCSKRESSQTEGVVEGVIESRMVVHEGDRGEPSVGSGSTTYREMQRNYKELEAIANWVLALPYTPKVGLINQASPSGSVGVAVATASKGVDIRVGVPLAKRNTLTEVKLAAFRGSVLIFTNMYQHGIRLPFHPWVQMMLAKLGYVPRQYNPNFWILLHGVYIAWWLAGLGEPTFE
ncbi:hypothetical protein ACE6H2_026514 [Prunus campanulata]